ncbi:MAG: ATP-binding cassette domain-containing protein [Lentimicrobiaceae bacterium]|nr:ATP-binding cassette domain-containing protein [Lentimicrobiaceae bacterium]MCB9023503.1 ATP-binding cassette domain-containing protein [Lentimicrobiaceae bacterium]HPG34129.1 ATP-binding cassette domain-containing protein [Lentimicrobium sp.]
MVTITLEKAGKKYNNDWIFSELNCTLSGGESVVILGSNGSGKSTLLQVIASAIMPTTGKATYLFKGAEIKPEQAFRLMSIAAPYIELIEEFSLTEMICFHRRMKPLVRNMSTPELIRMCQLEKNSDKPLKYFSSGMKQRLKLALAIMSDTPVLLLDEPITNLDHNGIDWYNDMVSKTMRDRLIVVSSNSITAEHSFCTSNINIEDYKKARQFENSTIFQ